VRLYLVRSSRLSLRRRVLSPPSLRLSISRRQRRRGVSFFLRGLPRRFLPPRCSAGVTVVCGAVRFKRAVP